MEKFQVLSAINIANYIIGCCRVDNLKLQKLLYYSQAVSLVLNKRPLFGETIRAWDYGPVVPCVYHKYKKYGLDIIPAPKSKNYLNDHEIVDLCLDCYGDESSVNLMLRAHRYGPWKDFYKPGKNKEIPVDAIYEYYKDVLELAED